MEGNVPVCSPLQTIITDSILNRWANAHGALLVEEAKLVDLCRKLGSSGPSADELALQRERVDSLRELSEALYIDALEFLKGPS